MSFSVAVATAVSVEAGLRNHGPCHLTVPLRLEFVLWALSGLTDTIRKMPASKTRLACLRKWDGEVDIRGLLGLKRFKPGAKLTPLLDCCQENI